ncbi:MAG: signal peptide peptidase SppA [Nitrospirae bacterium]|nr:signal peptide peptidase SppA [Nitrospirota bacterium]
MFNWLRRRLPGRKIAILPFTGTIFMKSTETYINIVRMLEKSKRVKGVILRMESHGGGAAASEMFYHALKRLSKTKPLYCYSIFAASGGYMACCGANKIFAPASGIVGSIGVLSLKPVFKDIMNRMGIGFEITKKGIHKDMSFFHRESTEEERLKMDALHEDIYQRFVEIVSEGRGIEKERVLSLATGELFSAKKGLELGLIDRICDFEEVLDSMSEETGVSKERVVWIKPRRPLLARLMGQSAGEIVDEVFGRFYEMR